MKKIFLFSAISVILVVVLSSCFLLQSYNLSGKWSITMYYQGSLLDTYSITITQNGNSITVSDSVDTFNGTVNGNNVQFSYSDSSMTLSFTGTISDSTHMSGTWTITGSGLNESGTWSAVKQ
jgi:hypothetical protein